MKMDGWKDHLHFAFGGEHVLLPNLHLDSIWKFTIASVLAVFVCVSERLLTYALAQRWGPKSVRRSRMRNALWRASLYWLVTFDRLMYMLIAMTFNVWLITVTVTTLSVGQFIIEYLDSPLTSSHPPDPENHDFAKEPLLASSYYHSSSLSDPQSHSRSHSHSRTPSHPQAQPRSLTSPLSPSQNDLDSYSPVESYPPPPPLRPQPVIPPSNPANASQQYQRPRSKSKPDTLNIFIHPNESNIARAEAVAQELGLSGETELVKANVYHEPEHDGEGWELGKGRDVARGLLGR